jgi:hypothetical protein
MPITKLHLGRVYRHEGKDVVVTREWTSEDGHMRIEGHAVDGYISFDRAKPAFMESTENVVQLA